MTCTMNHITLCIILCVMNYSCTIILYIVKRIAQKIAIDDIKNNVSARGSMFYKAELCC